MTFSFRGIPDFVNFIKMKDNSIKTLPERTNDLISSGRYKDAITLLRRRLSENPIPGCLNRLNLTDNTYKYLLQYYLQGASDPGRDNVLADIRRDLSSIADYIDRERLAEDSSDQYFSTLRMSRLRPIDIKATLASLIERKSMAELAIAAGSYPIQVLSQVEEAEDDLFDTMWVADSIPSDIYRYLSDSIRGGAIPYGTASNIIAGVGLGLMKYYNHDAFMMLCGLVSVDDYKISARAAIMLVLALNQWSKRVADDKTLVHRLESLLEEDGISKKMRIVIFALIKAKDTDRVTKKMRKEVIPGLMQFGPDIMKRMKDVSQETLFSDIDGNPEWEDLLKNSGLEEKLRELTEMQSDGADVMMAAFSNLKGFPFFRKLRNWLLPFSINHTLLNSIRSVDDGSISALFEMNGMMCDSDKYSFAFSLANMSEMQRRMVMTQMHGQMEHLREQMKELEIMKAGHEFEEETIRFCRDIYRFYKLYPKHSEFYDPFIKFVEFKDIPVLNAIFDSIEDVVTVAEFYFKRGYYVEALPLLKRLTELSGDTPHLWEKIGFCYEKMSGRDKDAVESYMKAQLFNPDSKWISRRLALCYRRMGDYRNALEYMRLSLPDDGSFDFRISLMIVDMLMGSDKWDEALNELYHVDYERPGDAAVVRRMAQCAFRIADFDKTLSLLDSIPDLEKSEEDYRLKGHICFLRRNIPGAVDCYRMTVRPNDKRRLWKTNILSDLNVLESLGASKTEMLLLLDAMVYTLES